MNATRTARVLRILFIIGFAYLALSSIVPDTRFSGQTLHLWLNTGGRERLISEFDCVGFNFRLGQNGWGIYLILIMVATFVFLALAIFRPRRWVFITGAIFNIVPFLLQYCFPRNGDIHVLLFSLVAWHIAGVLTLSGFAVKWPRPAPKNPNLTLCPDCGRVMSVRAAACPKCGAPQSLPTAAA